VIQYCCAAIDNATGEVAHLNISPIPLDRNFSIIETDDAGVRRDLELHFFTTETQGNVEVKAWDVRGHMSRQENEVKWKASADSSLKAVKITKEDRRIA